MEECSENYKTINNKQGKKTGKEMCKVFSISKDTHSYSHGDNI